MLQLGRYAFRRAASDDDFEQIHRLNYRTFVEEIPQHDSPEVGRLIDKFHHKNTYYVATIEQCVVGMICMHDEPPFSIATRLPDAALLHTAGRRRMEVRLLAVEPAHRGGPVMLGLLWTMLEHARGAYDEVYISGVVDRVPMYERLGFAALGPPVPDGSAAFVPMRVTLPVPEHVERLARGWLRHVQRARPCERGLG